MRGLLSPSFLVFHSREFLWKQSLESLPSLESPGPYPGGPAAKPRPAAGVCVGVWPWRFIICGRREALPLEVFLLSSNKGLWPGPPGEQTSAEEATGPALTSPPGCQPPHFSLLHPWWAPASLCLAPLSCLLLLHVADMSLTLFTFLPSPGPTLSTVKMSHICALFLMPTVCPKASFQRSLFSLPVIDIDNSDNITRENADLIALIPCSKPLKGSPLPAGSSPN